MFKAVLTFFLMTPAAPMTQLSQAFPNEFRTKDECQAFLDAIKESLMSDLEIAREVLPELLSYGTCCVEVVSGLPI